MVVLLRGAGYGETSGMELGLIGQQGVDLFDIANGRVTRLIAYLDRDRADLGLTPKRENP